MNKELYITEFRQAVAEFNQAMAKLREKRRVWTSQDLGNTLNQDDFTGENDNLTVADLTGGMVSIDALEALLSAGHATNLDNLARY